MQSETKDYAVFEVTHERDGEKRTWGNEIRYDGKGGVWGLSCAKNLLLREKVTERYYQQPD